MSPELTALINSAEKSPKETGVIIVEKDMAIIDYLTDKEDKKGKEILRLLGSDNSDNTGIVLMFDSIARQRDLVFVIRLKNFDEKEENGLFAAIITDLHINNKGADNLKKMIEKSIEDEKLLEKIIETINSHINMSIEYNA